MKMSYRSIHLYSIIAATAFVMSAAQVRAITTDGSLDAGYGSALAIQGRLGRGRVVQYKTDGALALLERQLLKCENVDILIGESLANFSKRSRPVF